MQVTQGEGVPTTIHGLAKTRNRPGIEVAHQWHWLASVDRSAGQQVHPKDMTTLDPPPKPAFVSLQFYGPTDPSSCRNELPVEMSDFSPVKLLNNVANWTLRGDNSTKQF